MNTKILSLLVGGLLLASTNAYSAPFEPKFSDYPFAGTQFTVDAAANAYFATNYGIDISNAYLYKDSRDTFDGIGIANGTVLGLGTPQTGQILFLDSTDFVSFDYLTILATGFSVFDEFDNLLGTLNIGANSVGTNSFSSATRIAKFTWSTTGGYGAVSGLRYDYDGKTDGTNTDLDGNAVPDGASTVALLGLALGAIISVRRRLS